MSLGFSVEALLPHGRSGTRLEMGLRRVSESGWLQPDFDRAARVAAFDAHPDAVQTMPRAEAAGRETAEMAGVEGGLEDAARARWEDFCLLQPGDDGQYVLTAAALAFPTDWHLADKMGKPLTAIHAPIHGYAEQLAAGVDHFFASLKAGPIYGRANWFVVPTDAWRYMPQDDPETRFAQVTADNAGETLFIRCERQTLRRLPRSGAVLFTIGIAVEPLAALPAAAARRIADSVTSLSEGEGKRRAAPFYAEALLGYVASLETQKEAAA